MSAVKLSTETSVGCVEISSYGEVEVCTDHTTTGPYGFVVMHVSPDIGVERSVRWLVGKQELLEMAEVFLNAADEIDEVHKP